MYLTGFADEGAQDIDNQIRITKALGWNNIEARSIDGTNIHDLPEDKFEEVAGKLADAGVKVNCFGSTIANWACQIADPFEDTIERVERAIPRMQKLDTKLVRVMSYAFPSDMSDLQEEERFSRLREITLRFLDAGLQPVHENCMNYGGMSYQHTLKMIECVPGLRLVFDTGNPVFNKDRSKPEPWPWQSSWEFYSNVKEHIEYIHIKDAQMTDGSEEPIYTYPGEGDGDVKRILDDLLASGYDGGISIEPHLATVFHADDAFDAARAEETYTEYGQRIINMLGTSQ
jgi:sugar phosphate isomerase/epimerase